MRREADIAWAAGLFEGEGSITTSSRDGRYLIHLQLGTSDIDVLEKFHRIAGCGSIGGPYRPRKSTKPFWVWRTAKLEAVKEVLAMLEPHLCERRKQQITDVFARKAGERAKKKGGWVPRPLRIRGQTPLW